VNTVFNLNSLQSRNVIASDKTDARKEEIFQLLFHVIYVTNRFSFTLCMLLKLEIEI